jgi:hypothetical protein
MCWRTATMSKTMVSIIRDWLRKASRTMAPGGEAVWAKYLRFRANLDGLCRKLDFGPKEKLIFVDLSYLAKW